jgi:hypothetical protein
MEGFVINKTNTFKYDDNMIQKIIIFLCLILIAANAFSAAGPTNFIYNARLQSDLNGGATNSLTNLNNVTASNFVGNGSGLTGVTAGLATNVPTLTAGTGTTIVTNGSPTITNYVINSAGGVASNAIGNTNGYGTNTFLSAPTLTNATVATGLTLAAGATNNITNNLPSYVLTNAAALVASSGGFSTNQTATNFVATNSMAVLGSGTSASLILQGTASGGTQSQIIGSPAGIILSNNGTTFLFEGSTALGLNALWSGNNQIGSNLSVGGLSTTVGGITNRGRYDFSNSANSSFFYVDTNGNMVSGYTNALGSNLVTSITNGNVIAAGAVVAGTAFNGPQAGITGTVFGNSGQFSNSLTLGGNAVVTNGGAFYGNGSGLTNIPVGAIYDGRYVFDAKVKAQNIVSGVPFLLMTNNGPCTIDSIRDAMYGGAASDSNSFFNAKYSIVADGITNIVTSGFFTLDFGQVHPFWGGDNMSLSKTQGISQNCCGQRGNLEINAFTNLWVTITMTNTIAGCVFSDIVYAVGSPTGPPSHRVWHWFETNVTVSALTGVSLLNVTNSGEVRSVSFAGLNIGNGSPSLGFLEDSPTLVIDTTNSFLANGVEDFFHTTGYGEGHSPISENYGWICPAVYFSPFYNTNWGSSSQSAGISAYRFFPHMPFNSTYSLVWTNSFSGGAVQTWWTGTYWTSN